MGSQAPYIASGISCEQARQCHFVQQMVSLLPQQLKLSPCQDAYGKLTIQSRSSRRIAWPCVKTRGAAFVFSNSVGQIFCFAPVMFSGARFGPHFDYSCIKWGTKSGSQFLLPFSFFSRSTFIKKSEYKTNVHNNCTSRLLCMLWVAYLIAIGYGIDEAVWINVDETPTPYRVGGRHGWKKQPHTRTQRSNG